MTTLIDVAKRFGRDEEGASLAEYGLLLAPSPSCVSQRSRSWERVSPVCSTRLPAQSNSIGSRQPVSVSTF